MGIYDRDYYRAAAPRGGLGAMRMWSVNTWLIAINVAVFLLDNLANGALTDWGYFSVATAISQWQVWRFVTFQFLHAGFQHILFNMLGLYFFGPIVEMYLGSRPYLVFYLLCGIAGGLGYILLDSLGLLHYGPDTPLVGASAGIFGVLIGAARIAPDVRVMLLFPPIPMKLRTLAWLCIAIAVYAILVSGNNAGGQAAHLGGALVGFLLIRNMRRLDFLFRRRPRILPGGSQVVYKDWNEN